MKKRFKLNVTLRGHPKGSILSIEVDKKHVPIEPYWRSRFYDSLKDNCIEHYNTTKENKVFTVKKGKVEPIEKKEESKK